MATSSIQEIFRTFHSRKLLLYPSFNQSSASALTTLAPSKSCSDLLQPLAGGNSFDADIILVLTVLLCALICSLGLNLLIRCAFKCSSLVSPDDYLRNGNNSGSSTDGKLANRGMNKKVLKTFPVLNYSPDLKIPGLESVCVICLMEFSTGGEIKILPECNHGFHVKCIDRWLNCNSSCPTCRYCLLESCNKILECGNSNVSPQEIINIAALEPESMVRNHQT